MANIRISEEQQAAIDAQPERKPPLSLSRDKTAGVLIEEALEKRRAALKRKPRLAR